MFARYLVALSLLLGSPWALSEESWKPLTNEVELRKMLIAHSNLKDPSSSQFRNTVWKKSTGKDGSPLTIWCGEINAKNSMGGYTGFHSFFVFSEDQGKKIVGIADGKLASAYQIMIDAVCEGTGIAGSK